MRYALAVVAALFALPAMAQGVLRMEAHCYPVQDAIAILERDHGEVPVGLGTTQAGDAAFLLLLNPDNGSFTIARITPDGVACLLGGGVEWVGIAPKPTGDPA